jgi:AcrR family transcriptional regulator
MASGADQEVRRYGPLHHSLEQGTPVAVVESERRTEILNTAAEVFASAGIRASLKDIADACGIMSGSLYHHFDSKEAIVIELVRRYRDELSELADRAEAQSPVVGVATLDAVVEFGVQIAECATRHRAALLLTYYEPPTVYGSELADLAAGTQDEINRAMRALLTAAHTKGRLRSGPDLDILADWLCQAMLHVGIGVFHRSREARDVPRLKCRMLLGGLGKDCPPNGALDQSEARLVADAVIAGWAPDPLGGEDRAALVLRAARSEFGRRGFEATTIRDVASAAGVDPRTVYRVVDSKEQLLMMILDTYVSSVTNGWNAVLTSSAAPIEQLDALQWLDINLLDRFSEEHRIQSVSLQYAPPVSPNLGLSFPTQLRQMRQLLADADSAGQLGVAEGSADVRARCAFSLIWMPDNIIRDLTPVAASAFAREVLLRGAAAPAA